MSHPGQSESGKPTGRRRVGLLVAGTLLTGALAASWVAWRHPATATGPRSWIRRTGSADPARGRSDSPRNHLTGTSAPG